MVLTIFRWPYSSSLADHYFALVNIKFFWTKRKNVFLCFLAGGVKRGSKGWMRWKSIFSHLLYGRAVSWILTIIRRISRYSRVNSSTPHVKIMNALIFSTCSCEKIECLQSFSCTHLFIFLVGQLKVLWFPRFRRDLCESRS